MIKVIIMIGLFFANVARAEEVASPLTPARYFVNTATYGLLAGSLIGAASLAFTSTPENHTGNIFKGASLGLYAGMIYAGVKLYSANNNDVYALPTNKGSLIVWNYKF